MRRIQATAGTCALVIAATAGAAALPQLAEHDPSLLTRVHVAADSMERALPTLIATEVYAQRLALPQREERRLLRSEVGSTILPSTDGFVFVRNVVNVDGRQVHEEGRLDSVLREPLSDIRARVLAVRDEAARFNIGHVTRNLNEPTFALRLLTSALAGRFSFKARGTRRTNGRDLQMYEFRETARPTLVTSAGANVPASGSFLVAADGTVFQTTLTASFAGDADGPQSQSTSVTKAVITVDFARDARLDLVLPVRMHEDYRTEVTLYSSSGSRARTDTQEHIECDARYEGYRRFDTAARILP